MSHTFRMKYLANGEPDYESSKPHPSTLPDKEQCIRVLKHEPKDTPRYKFHQQRLSFLTTGEVPKEST